MFCRWYSYFRSLCPAVGEIGNLFQANFHLQLQFSFAYAFQAMHAGVLRDMEQQRIKHERKADFDMQRALEAEYRKVQNVHDGQSMGARSRAEGV